MYKWIVLLALYLSQGLPHGFFGQALPTFLRQQGMSLEGIGLMSLVFIPWVLKFLWAPLLDHYKPLSRLTGGRFSLHIRKEWILLANVMAAFVLAGISMVSIDTWIQEATLLLSFSLMVMTVFIVTQDIATDALAVENIPPAQRGLGNSLQVAGYRVGMIISGAVLLSAFAVLGWQGTLLTLSLLMIVTLIPLWFWKPAPVQVDQEPVFQHWLDFVRAPDMWLWLVMLVTYKFGDSFGTAMIRPQLVDLGMTLEQIAELMGWWGITAGLAGALLGGLLLKVLPRFGALLCFLLLEAVAIGSYSLLTGPDTTLLYILVVGEHVAGGMATVALFTVMMDRCRKGSAGSDYALQSALVVFSTLIASAVSGFSAQTFGYGVHYILAAWACVGGAVLVLMNRTAINESRHQQPVSSEAE